ncbi:MAG: hypothetical protein J1E64_00270 [Acetatifactor sp.]|nr:hypothetical protein [Acetatifactor sp.]
MFKDRKFFLFIIVGIFALGLVDMWIYSSCEAYTSTIRVDGIGYYAYLPATFIYKDISFSFLGNGTNSFLVNGVNRYPLGVAVCWMPLFFVAEVIQLFVQGNVTGYGFIYEKAILLNAIIYWVIGIACTYWLLCKKFEKRIALLSCVLITFGTRLFHYSSIDACLSHTYSFATIALFCVSFYRYFSYKTRWKAIICGVLLGLITNLRNVNIIIAIVPMMYILGDCVSQKDKIKYKNYLMDLLIAAIGFIIAFFPMMLYWKLSSGQWIYNSYGEWSFDWFHPQIIKVMFGEDTISGMIKLSPLLLVTIPGVIFMLRDKQSNRYTVIGLLLCLLVDLYLVCASWAPAGIGRRAYVNYLTLIAWPLAYFLQWLMSLSKKKRRVANVLLLFAVAWNCIEMVWYWFYW